MKVFYEMPYGYRHLTDDELDEFVTLDEDQPRWGWLGHVAKFSTLLGTRYIRPWDCMIEFGMSHDHDPEECERIMADMSSDSYDPMDDIPWGTPDSWIPDNPNEDGFCQSDFI
jgi:hypothetical protein